MTPTRAGSPAALALAACLAAGAAAVPAAQDPAQPPGLVVTIEQPSTSWWERASSAFDSLLTVFLPPSPAEVAQQLNAEASVFWGLLADAGYELDEVETTAGLLPGVAASFRMARELSPGDRDAVERRLDALAREDGGPVAGLQRSVILMLLEASEAGTYRVERVQVTLSPIPKARFTLKPAPTAPGAGLAQTPGALGRP